MDIRAALLKVYFNIESAYYEFLDAVDNHAPVYKLLVNPIENRGYPSFPFYALVIIAIVLLLFLSAAVPQKQTSALLVSITDEQGRPLSGTQVSVLSPGGGDFLLISGQGETDLTGRADFVGIPLGRIRIEAGKEGYESKQVTLEEFRKSVVVSLSPSSETRGELRSNEEAQAKLQQRLQELADAGQPQFLETFREAQAGLESLGDAFR
ncbi:carboxypeptidase regulatory-like domain-containing protein [Candidatus Micrarchaeota archaeon]|nr:carboxypeptidase regulatory-like domain-containing protein [Candidatus Micrarchaeota archaeon]